MAEERKCSESGCSGNCEGCAKAPHTKADFLEPANPGSAVKRIIGVVSGKGGVGKSTVTSMLAVLDKPEGVQRRHSGRRHHRPLDSEAVRHS